MTNHSNLILEIKKTFKSFKWKVTDIFVPLIAEEYFLISLFHCMTVRKRDIPQRLTHI